MITIYPKYIKPLLDLIIAAFGLVLLAPLFLLIGLLIVITSPGPVFYRGLRSGRYGREFRIFKFRTMCIDAEKKGGGTTGLNDPRVTRIGRSLRRLKFDELPQLINILKGEMSLVGPRPELPYYTSQYTPAEREILSVRPGITDLSSIEFASLDEIVGSEDVDRVYEEKVFKRKNELRLYYAKNCSLLLDAAIICKTFGVLLGKLFSLPKHVARKG